MINAIQKKWNIRLPENFFGSFPFDQKGKVANSPSTILSTLSIDGQITKVNRFVMQHRPVSRHT